MVLLDNDPFLTQLDKLFDKQRNKGSVFITMKRSDMKPRLGKRRRDKPDVLKTGEEKENYCLVRATDGRKVKLSTTVKCKDSQKFSSSYNTILKIRMDGLKKKEKEKVKVKQKS